MVLEIQGCTIKNTSSQENGGFLYVSAANQILIYDTTVHNAKARVDAKIM